MVQRPEGFAGLQKEDMLVIDLPGGGKGFSKTEMPSQDGHRARTQLNAAIFAGFGLISVNAGDSGFVDTDKSVHEIDVGEHEGDLLRGSQAGEKSETHRSCLGLLPNRDVSPR